jgi:hypothetical protein
MKNKICETMKGKEGFEEWFSFSRVDPMSVLVAENGARIFASR